MTYTIATKYRISNYFRFESAFICSAVPLSVLQPTSLVPHSTLQFYTFGRSAIISHLLTRPLITNLTPEIIGLSENSACKWYFSSSNFAFWLAVIFVQQFMTAQDTFLRSSFEIKEYFDGVAQSIQVTGILNNAELVPFSRRDLFVMWLVSCQTHW